MSAGRSASVNVRSTTPASYRIYPEGLRLTPPQLAVLIGIVSLTFFFGALILAFGLRIQQQKSWEPFAVPDILWLGTTFLLLSSWTLEGARRALKRALVVIYRGRLTATIILALMFLWIQSVSAYDLVAQGVATAGNPHGSAFYVFMGIHGVHLLGGICSLVVLSLRSRLLFFATESDLRQHRRALGAAAIYWHFMGALWLVLYLFLKRWTAG
jgi:cytochrome c oxidase subunit 3